MTSIPLISFRPPLGIGQGGRSRGVLAGIRLGSWTTYYATAQAASAQVGQRCGTWIHDLQLLIQGTAGSTGRRVCSWFLAYLLFLAGVPCVAWLSDAET